jgi:mono/diheme cytochrome c family protein
MRAWAIIAMAVAVGMLAVVGAAAAMLLRGGISARTEPSSIEASLAFNAQRLALRTSRDKLNPVKATPEVMSSGMSHFADHCASCHANDGRRCSRYGTPDSSSARYQSPVAAERRLQTVSKTGAHSRALARASEQIRYPHNLLFSRPKRRIGVRRLVTTVQVFQVRFPCATAIFLISRVLVSLPGRLQTVSKNSD